MPLYRHSARSFARLAPSLGKALATYPSVTTLPNPNGWTSDTHAEYFRRCKKSKQLNPKYTHPSVDEELFALYADVLQIRIMPTAILIGSKENLILADAHSLASQPETASSQLEVTAESSHYEDVVNLARLAGKRIMTPQPIFIVQCSDHEARELESHSVVMIKHGTNTWKMM